MERPSGVTVIAVLDFLGAGGCLIGALAFGALTSVVTARGSNSPLGRLAGLGGAIGIALFFLSALFAIVIGVGLLKLRNWARVLSVVFAVLGIVLILAGLVLTFAHLSAISVVSDMLFLALDCWIAWYLMRSNVREAFTPARG